MTEAARFKESVRRLHAEKDTAYGSAWKRRGELISVLANIARKVDRLEQAAAGAPATRDESVLDTAVDLLVYSLKYQTYLADQDGEVAISLFGVATGPFSDGRGGFEALLDALDLRMLDDEWSAPGVGEAGTAVIAAFSELEMCFATGAVASPAPERWNRAVALTRAAGQTVAALRRESPILFDDFLRVWKRDV